MRKNELTKTKIVATIGPASSSYDALKKMIEEGMDVCRLNFSHGSHEDHMKVIETVRQLNEEMQTHVALVADLQGPKLRVGQTEGDGVELVAESQVIITPHECVSTSDKLYVNYDQIAKDTKAGERILLDDGKLELEVTEVGADEITTKVVTGGKLTSNKGVNLPNTKISLPSLTEKDHADLDFALEQGLSWIAISFVRSARDIIEIKHLLSERKSSARVIAKIEKPEALEDIEEIAKSADALMVARGDLGVEMPMQSVPLIQKMIVKTGLKYGRPVIIATQMMESMITSPTPTRAEVNDVANAVLDGADAVMLSGETSVGDHPERVIAAMNNIIEEIETFDGIYYHERLPEQDDERFITDNICYNAVTLAHRAKAKAIVTMTHSGYTAYKVSSQRPKADIFVFTANRAIMSQLSLVWGVRTFYYDKMVSTDHTIEDIKYLLKKGDYVTDGDLIINIASMPITEQGKSNMLKMSNV